MPLQMLSMASKWWSTIMVNFACGGTAIHKLLQMVVQGQREMQCNQVSTKITIAKKIMYLWKTDRKRQNKKNISTEITLPVAVTSSKS